MNRHCGVEVGVFMFQRGEQHGKALGMAFQNRQVSCKGASHLSLIGHCSNIVGTGVFCGGARRVQAAAVIL